jgi:hypothetical protein
MKKYIASKRDLISVDTENLQDIECIDNCSTGIDWAWILPWDGEFNGEPVKKGEIIVKFYGRHPDLPSKMIIIRDPEICKHLYLYNNREISDSCPSCEQCCDNA